LKLDTREELFIGYLYYDREIRVSSVVVYRITTEPEAKVGIKTSQLSTFILGSEQDALSALLCASASCIGSGSQRSRRRRRRRSCSMRRRCERRRRRSVAFLGGG
jgi:hypothetical protein